MTDLTVLFSPSPLYTHLTENHLFQRSTPCLTSTPVNLEPHFQRAADSPPVSDPTQSPFESRGRTLAPMRRRTAESPPTPHLLSPPTQTFRSASSRPRHSKHRLTRSQSAPPARLVPKDQPRTKSPPEPFVLSPPSTSILDKSFPRRSFTTLGGIHRSTGQLIPPPPPLLRPTTFWRKTRRSGVTSASFSPSSHLIRRSTFIAAGLSFDAPIHDLSAPCVESRVKFIVLPPDYNIQ